MSAVLDARSVPVGVRAENIPEALRKMRRWVVWLPKWDGEKFGKKPGRIDRPGVGLANWGEAGWVDFDTAVQAYQKNRTAFGGIGLVLSNAPGITGIDLDRCIDDQGNVAPWAAEIVAQLDSYTEISPSGRGLRAFVVGEVPDWQVQGPDVRMEVYGGKGGRFLTVTGACVDGAPKAVCAARPGVMEALKEKYYRAAPKRPPSNVEPLHIPDVLPDFLLPDVDDLDLPAYARNFLSDGPAGGDRSRELFATAIALVQAGLTREEVFSVLANNDHALEIAQDHWKGHPGKALRFLWAHSAQKGAERAEDFRQLVLDEFPDYDDTERSDPPAPAPALTPSEAGMPASADDFDMLPDDAKDNRHVDLAPKKKPRFSPESAAEFLNHAAPSWLIKGVLPRAGLAVIYGASSSGKTFFTLDLIAAVARGEPWRGVPVKKGRVLYVVAEGAGGFRNRLKAYCAAHDLDPADLDICFLRQTPNLLTKDDIREFLKEIIAAGPFALIVIDTYARAMSGGNENDAKDVGQAVAHCDIIHRKTGAMVILVHHSGKDATKGARGSGALRAAADLEIEVVQTREYRAASITKQKDGADGVEYKFKLAVVDIGIDEDDETVTSCVVEPLGEDDTGRGRKENPEGANEKLIFQYLDNAPDGSVARAGLLEDLVGRMNEEVAPGQKDRRKERLGRALKSLARKNLLEDDGLYVTIK